MKRTREQMVNLKNAVNNYYFIIIFLVQLLVIEETNGVLLQLEWVRDQTYKP